MVSGVELINHQLVYKSMNKKRLVEFEFILSDLKFDINDTFSLNDIQKCLEEQTGEYNGEIVSIYLRNQLDKIVFTFDQTSLNREIIINNLLNNK